MKKFELMALPYADDAAEVDVLDAFGHDDVFAADGAQAESFLCIHILLVICS